MRNIPMVKAAVIISVKYKRQCVSAYFSALRAKREKMPL